MKRLTKTLDNGRIVTTEVEDLSYGETVDGCFLNYFTGEAINRLAAYEDTGMEPEEVKAKCAWADNVCKMLSGIFEDSGVFDFSHIKELITAKQEGRLIVLPCKVGKHLYAATRNIISEFEVKGFEIDGSGMVWVTWEVVSGMYGHFRIDGIPDDAIGKTVFLTRAEAEKAMKGVSEDA